MGEPREIPERLSSDRLTKLVQAEVRWHFTPEDCRTLAREVLRLRRVEEAARTALPFLHGAHFNGCSIFGSDAPMRTMVGKCDCGTNGREASIRAALSGEEVGHG